VDVHIEHAVRFIEELPPEACSVVDLGSGGGLPGLVIAALNPDRSVMLVDRRQRSVDFLRRAVAALGIEERCVVMEADAAVLGRDLAYREQADAVVARSVDAPGVTAELAAGLVRVGGMVLVSEGPDGGRHRWPTDELLELGLRRIHGGSLTKLEKVAPLRARFPRLRQRRPLF
jgi:16S rRNA (guanine527-N7)-methyltransferase